MLLPDIGSPWSPPQRAPHYAAMRMGEACGHDGDPEATERGEGAPLKVGDQSAQSTPCATSCTRKRTNGGTCSLPGTPKESCTCEIKSKGPFLVFIHTFSVLRKIHNKRSRYGKQRPSRNPQNIVNNRMIERSRENRRGAGHGKTGYGGHEAPLDLCMFCDQDIPAAIQRFLARQPRRFLCG